SAFFHNYSRMTWSIRKHVSTDNDDLITVSLTPHKQNDGARVRPVGLEFTFSPERIEVRGVEVSAVEGLAEHLPLAARMIPLLLKRGPLTVAEIAEQLGAKPDSVFKAAGRGSAFTKHLSMDGITS